MKKIKNLLTITISVLIIGCAGDSQKNSTKEGLSGDIKIDGSSTVYPVSEAVAEEFRNVEPNVRVTVGVSGTGGGFKKVGRDFRKD